MCTMCGVPRPSGFELNRYAFEDILRIRGTSLTDVAAECPNIARSTLSTMVGGHNKASIPIAHELAKALGVQPETLFPGLIPDLAVAGQRAANGG